MIAACPVEHGGKRLELGDPLLQSGSLTVDRALDLLQPHGDERAQAQSECSDRRGRDRGYGETTAR